MRRLRIADCELRIEGGGLCCASQSSIVNRQSSIGSGFSLAELMIAIAILGIGLLVVASMFPIAWGRARDLSEHTTAVSCAETAEMTVKLVTRVDSADPCRNYTSFAGDYVVETHHAYTVFTPPISSWDLNVHPPSDTKVHPLTLENVLAIAPGGGASPIITEETWRLTDALHSGDGPDGDRYQIIANPRLAAVCRNQDYVAWYDTPQVRFHQRVFPPVGPYPEAVTPPDEEIDEWLARLDTRRFGWAVFHRLTKAIHHPVPPTSGGPIERARFNAERRAAARAPRTFNMYYVTLRRGRGQRFIVQDEGALESGDVKAQEHTSTEPTDLRFPSPWLVPIKTPDPTDTNRSLNFRVNPSGESDVVPRGVPTEVLVEVPANSDDFRDFFPPGAQFIDSVNGEVFRVVKTRYDDDGFGDGRFSGAADQQQALLTLDREIFVEDLVDPLIDPRPPRNEIPGNIPVDQRRVWVFPPAVERLDEEAWAVDGPSPVVAVEVRSLVMRPG